KPITIKKDTVTFLTKSFAQGNEQVVEDLLKKIPGLNITDDGTIKVGNQEVEKVMIDGDDFFERGYKILTKNMPANPVEKVEVLQRYSNNKHLKGIENSDKVALNLTLKEDFNRQWFGNVETGYGLVSENRYSTNANVMNFGKKNKYFFTTNLNNTGQDATGDINHLIRPYRDDGISSIGDNASANSLLMLGLGSANLKPKRVNFNNAEMFSLNSIFTINNQLKAKVLGFFNTDENDFFRNSSDIFFGNNTNFTNTENFIGSKTNLTGFGKFDLTYDISKTKTWEYTAKFNKANLKEKSNLLFNDDLLNENITSRNELLDHKMIFTNKYKENKVFVLTGRYIKEKTPQDYTINKFLLSDLFSENANNTAQTSENKMEFYGFEAHLLDKKNKGSLLEIQMGNQLRIDFLNTQFTLKNNETILSKPLDFKNNLKYSVNDLYLKAKYIFKIKKINLMLQSNFHQFNNTIFENNISNTQNPFFINPKIGMEWEIDTKNKIVTSYSYNTKNAGLLDVYSNSIQTSFRSFDKAAGTFNQLDETTALFNYTYGGWSDKFFANALMIYSKNFDFFSTNSTIAPNYSLQEKILIKDRDYWSVSINMDRYLKLISSNLKVNIGGSKSNFKNSVNNSDLREVKNQTLNYGFELRSGFRGVFNYHLGSKWDFNQVKTTTSNEFTNNMSF
ncbi:MAG: TonB-dependent receptor, partial [Flavobacterium sp.]